MAQCSRAVPRQLRLSVPGTDTPRTGKDDVSELSTASWASPCAASSPPPSPASSRLSTPRQREFLDVRDAGVKNTFIHISEEAARPPRRGRSCPAGGLTRGSLASRPPAAHQSARSDAPATNPGGAHAVCNTRSAMDGSGACLAPVAVAVCCPTGCTCGVPPLQQRRAPEHSEQDVQLVLRAAHAGQFETLWRMCHESATSSWAVQEAVGRATAAAPRDAPACGAVDTILRALRGHVSEAARDPHANYVLQRIVESLPAARVDFVAGELAGLGVGVARDSQGCRIVLRLFRHLSCDACAGGASRALMGEVAAGARELVAHKYGRHVAQEILESGLPRHRRQVAAALLRDTAKVASNMHGSWSVQKALECCCAEDARAIAGRLMGDPGRVWPKLARGPGSHVLRALLSSERHSRDALGCLRQLVPVPEPAGEGGLSGAQLSECLEGLARARRAAAAPPR